MQERSPEGWWYGYQRTTSLSHVPFLGAVEAVAEAVSRVEIRRSGEEASTWSARWEVLSLKVDSGSRWIRTVLPKPVVESMPILERTIVPEAGGYRWPRATTVTGARLDHPERDALPTRLDDPRLLSLEGLGRGARIEVSGMVRGHLQVVQRAWSTLASSVEEDGVMVARVLWGVEQSVLSASHLALRRPPQSTPTDDIARNHAVFFRGTGPEDEDAEREARRLSGRALDAHLVYKLRALSPITDVVPPIG